MYAEVGPDTRGADVRDVAERMIAAGATNYHDLELVYILAVIGGTGDRRGDGRTRNMLHELLGIGCLRNLTGSVALYFRFTSGEYPRGSGTSAILDNLQWPLTLSRG